MDNRDRLIRDVAKDVDLPTKVAEAVVSSQFRMAREMVQTGVDKSVYFRKIGYLIPTSVLYDLTGQFFETRNNKAKEWREQQKEGEDPITFN